MAPAPAMQRETVRLPAAILVAVRALRLALLRRSAGDEGRQRRLPSAGLRRLLLLLARWWRLLRAGCRVWPRAADNCCCRAARRAAHSAAGRAAARPCRTPARPNGLAVLVAAFLELLVRARLELLVVAARPRAARLEVRIVLAELLLRRRDQPEIMFGVLEIIFGRDRIAGGLGVTRELKILLRDVIGRTANLHIGAVRFVNPCQRVMIAPVICCAAVLLLRPRIRLLW